MTIPYGLLDKGQDHFIGNWEIRDDFDQFLQAVVELIFI
jgi:hypothetical protein